MKRKSFGLGRIILILLLITFFYLILVGIIGYRKALIPVSFLPSFEKIQPDRDEKKTDELILDNRWFKLVADTHGNISVRNSKNEIILSGLTYCADYEGFDNLMSISNVRVWHVSDSVLALSGNVYDKAELELTITVHSFKPEVDFDVKTRYLQGNVVRREALIADFGIPVTEVYLKNRMTDLAPLYNEYWLEKQGVKLGSGDRSALIYHQQDISSMQLDTKKSALVVNLEYYLDHPFIHIPYQEDGGGRWTDISSAEYHKGDERHNHFSIVFGSVPELVPRLTLFPHGFLAGYVFTEHADGGNIRTHRAAYFGSEKITNISEAKSGFAGHGIPVTKSIFFEYFDDGLSAGATEDSPTEREFLDFLDQLYAAGFYDLCLHTPENSNSNRKSLEDAISAMKIRYDAESWIDHGMFPGNNNRETLVSDGLNPSSEFYSADLWERNGTRFFWSPAVEAIRFSKPGVSLKEEVLSLRLSNLSAELWRRYNFRNQYFGENPSTILYNLAKGHFPMFELNSHQPLNGPALPTPLFWQNETVSGALYSWTTEYVYHGLSNINSENQLELEKRSLDLLVANRGVFFNHGYYVRNGIDDNIITEQNGELVINPYFDKVLEYMDLKRDNNDLYLTTVKELLNYWLLLKNVEFNYQPDGTVIVVNKNNVLIEGISFAVRADEKRVTVDGITPQMRKYGEDTIFWIDLPANDKRTITFINQ